MSSGGAYEPANVGVPGCRARLCGRAFVSGGTCSCYRERPDGEQQVQRAPCQGLFAERAWCQVIMTVTCRNGKPAMSAIPLDEVGSGADRQLGELADVADLDAASLNLNPVFSHRPAVFDVGYLKTTVTKGSCGPLLALNAASCSASGRRSGLSGDGSFP